MSSLNHVSISTAAELIEGSILHAFQSGIVPANIMVQGSPGVAKSSIIRQAADKIGQAIGKPVKVIDVRLGTMDQAEVHGMPHNVETGEVLTVTTDDGAVHYTPVKSMVYSTPAWFPTDDGCFYILFFDELTNASVGVQHAAYKIVLDRELTNGAKLPTNCAIVAAGNLKTDGTGAKPLLRAMANRFAMHLTIDIEQSFNDFINYFTENHFHRSIVGFLNWRKSNVYQNNGVDDAFATPRSWEYCNHHLNNGIFQTKPHLMDIAIAGAIGTAVAVEFAGYREYESKLPNWSKVRSGEEEYKVPNIGEEGMVFAIATALAYECFDARGKKEEFDNLLKVVDQLSNEALAICFRTMGALDKGMGSLIMKSPTGKSIFNRASADLKAARV